MKKYLSFMIMFFVIFTFVGCEVNDNTPGLQNPPAQEQPDNGNDIMGDKMNLKINNKTFVVNLENNATTKALIKMLPMTINMSELNGNEKYYHLENSLPTNASRVSQINAGDIMLWGNDCLVIFYKSFSSGYSYTRLGHIESATDLASSVGNGSVQIVWTI